MAIDGTEGDGGPATAAKIDFVKGLKIAARRSGIYKPTGVAVGTRGVYLTDPLNLRSRRVDFDGTMHTLAGSSRPCVRFGIAFDGQCEDDGGDGGPASGARFFVGPLHNLSVSPQGLVAVVSNGRIRVINDSDQPITLFPASAHPLTIQLGYIDSAGADGATQ